MLRPDAVLQGLGCVAMGCTVLTCLCIFDTEHTLLDLNDHSNASVHVLALCCCVLAPACMCCGSLMLWYGCGGSFGPSFTHGFRCDLLVDDDLEARGRDE
mmetsp:Transcript_56475/g.126116  ORF Transcript_56475/g.126116 Transcript_56475/m.126116 type:complete len:100 (-) Transcript_56475:665-964(-)